jgi:TatD DNase family protein
LWIDSHCHLNHDRLLHLGGPGEIIKNARAADIDGMLTICCRAAEEFDALLDIARSHDNVWCTVGTHPHDASQPGEQAITEDALTSMALRDDNIVGIGETGLDYYYKFSSHEDQHENFRKNIRAALAADLPVVVHSRDAEADTMRIIREEGQGGKLKGVMHCFSSGRILAEEALDYGFYISFSGIITFKKSEELRDIARIVPLDRLLVETDAPFLAPEPHRKRINEPALVPHTGQVLADLYNLTHQEVAAATKSNFFKLFPKALKTYKNNEC